MSILRLLVLLVVMAALPAGAEEGKAKFGPDALPLSQALDFLRSEPAPDYWKLAQFYVPQQTSSACSLASVTMAVNFFRGVPQKADETLVSQTGLLETVEDSEWASKSAEGGVGVLFDELVRAVTASLAAYGVSDVAVEAFQPQDAGPAVLAQMDAILTANEANEDDLLLVYFNQGVLTGDWDGPHISPIGAFDAKEKRVLIMDVDRDWYVPYWSSNMKLLEAMLRPAPAEHGPLAGATGGLVWLKRVAH